MNCKTIYIRYIASYNFTYLVREEYKDSFDKEMQDRLLNVWDFGSYELEHDLNTDEYLQSHAKSIFNPELTFVYQIPKPIIESTPTKDWVIPKQEAGMDVYPTIHNNSGNPPKNIFI
jgi:hypothetical protein